MARAKHIIVVLTVHILAALACSQPCQAHFLWLKTISHDDKPHAFLFFGESATDEAYHLPESLADSKVWVRAADGKRRELSLSEWEGEDRIGLSATLDGKPCVLEASEQYGVYGTALLIYCAKHVHAESADELNAAGPSKELKLDIVPRVEREQLELTVLWDGKPLADSKVSVAIGDAEAGEKSTDERGRIVFKPEGKGLVAVLANTMQKDLTGKLREKPYDHGLHYASLTFEWPLSSARETDETSASARPATLPDLPEPLSSFGAVVADGWLYVYGGHTGTEHDHSAANLSNHFRRISTQGGAVWEELPMQTPLQGLALVAHNGKVYRVGGMYARNATTDDEEDVHSTADLAEFDPATNSWKSLAPLPAPRSSHNAVVIGDRLFVVGGWSLAGKSPGKWQRDALVYDVTNPQGGWQKLPEPPFARRALAASHWNGNLVALGGLDTEGEVSQSVDIFDPQSGLWSQGPELPGAGVSGFGVSAWNLDDQLYVSGLRGVLYRLNREGSGWEEVTRLQRPRFFHQLVPAHDGGLLAVGGASRKGHLDDIESIRLGN